MILYICGLGLSHGFDQPWSLRLGLKLGSGETQVEEEIAREA